MLTIYQWNQWSSFKKLIVVLFGAWLGLFFVTHTFMKSLNKIVVPVLDLPLGSYIPGQAAMIVFAVTLFWFVRATRGAHR
ncbi:MAG: sodium/substrate symporter small subunit [Xanthobacteraceae bacterium]